MIITISGEEGAGKSTLARQLAEKLRMNFYSMGDLRKKYAMEHGMTLEQLNDLRKTDVTSDLLVDKYQVEIAKKENDFVIDGRLSFHFIPASFKVFVVADLAERARRVLEDIKAGKRPFEPYSNVHEVAAYLQKRARSNIDTYVKLYGVNPYDQNQYDLIVDSTNMTAEQKLEYVLDWLKRKGHI